MVTQKTHAGFCEGFGGFSLAARWAGYTTKVWVEPDPFCQAILKYYHPHAQGYDYIQNHNYEKYAGTIDLYTAGFPCQPASTAGDRKGTADDRWLWPAVKQSIIQMQPSVAILENVAGLLSILEHTGISKMEIKALQLFGEGNQDAHVTSTVKSIERRIIGVIIEDLETAGYSLPKLEDGTPIVLCIPAAGVNAPHKRDRLWLVAYRKGYGSSGTTYAGNGQSQNEEREGLQQHTNGHGCEQPAAHTNGDGQQHGQPAKDRPAQGEGQSEGLQWQRLWGYIGRSRTNASDTTGIGMERNGANMEQQSQCTSETELFRCHNTRTDWRNFPAESPVCTGNDGIPDLLHATAVLNGKRLTRSKWHNETIKAAGNAIVPQVALTIINAIDLLAEFINDFNNTEKK